MTAYTKTVTEIVTAVEVLANFAKKLASEAQSFLDTGTAVNLYYTAKYIKTDATNIQADVEAYLATIGTSIGTLKSIAIASISADNFGVLIVHS